MPAPVVIQPSDNSAYAIGSTIAFQWKDIPAADGYQIQFWSEGLLENEDRIPRTPSPTVTYNWNAGMGPWTIRIRAAAEAYGPWTTRTITGN